MLFDHISNLLSSDLGIDLGTSSTVIYGRDEGIVLREPSVLAVRKEERGADRILAVGAEAKKMLGRTPPHIKAIRPIKLGVISDLEMSEIMLHSFLKTVHRRYRLLGPRIIISVPIGITEVERRAVRDSAKSAGARQVFFLEEPIAAAIGAGLPIVEPTCHIVVDIGAGTTEVAVISLAGIVFSKSVRVGGDKMDEAILQYIQRKYHLLVGLNTAENIKKRLGHAYQNDETFTHEIKGRDLVTGIPAFCTVSANEIYEAISIQIDTIVETVHIALEQTPPELAGDLVEKGIMLTGGGSLLKDLKPLLEKRMKLPVNISKDPLSDVAIGCGKVLDNLSFLKETMRD